MHITKQPAGLVRADRDESQIKRSAILSNLCKRGTDGEVGELGSVVIDVVREGGNSAIPRVACEIDFCAAGLDAPGRPEGFAFVERCAG